MIYLILNTTGKPHFLGTMSSINVDIDSEGEKHIDRPMFNFEKISDDDSEFDEILDSYILEGHNLYNVYGVDKMSFEEIKEKYNLPDKVINDNLSCWKEYDYYKIRNKNIVKAKRKWREKKRLKDNDK